MIRISLMLVCTIFALNCWASGACLSGYTLTKPEGPLINYVNALLVWDNNQNIKYYSVRGNNGTNSGNMGQGSHAGMANGEWSVAWDDETMVGGMTECAPVSGTLAANCICRIEYYSLLGGEIQNIDDMPWNNILLYGNSSHCVEGCTYRCVYNFQKDSKFRSKLFGELAQSKECSPNTIDIYWDDGTNITQNTCLYGGVITLPPTPVRPGYKFGGWKIKKNN